MKKDSHLKKEIEYDEAPSGYVTFYRYKEPLMKFKGHLGKPGYGFIGALVYDGETDKIQCHLCGKWEANTLGNHLAKEHGMTAADYKEIVGLNNSTALISESYRDKLVSSGQERFNNLRPGKKKSQETKDKIAETLRNQRAEMKNLNNTCPEQLLERLRKMSVDNDGFAPTITSESSNTKKGFAANLKCVYGSYEEACKKAGVPYRKPGLNKRWEEKYREAVKWIADFIDKNQWLPKGSKECPPSYTPDIFSKNRKKLIKDAMIQLELQKPYGEHNAHDLLEFLCKFKERWGREPSRSDCVRGLLPNESAYRREFGSLKKAKKLAYYIH